MCIVGKSYDNFSSNNNKSFDVLCSEAIILTIILLVWYYCTLKQYYSEKEAAIMAANERSFTHLRTNTGKLYRSTFFSHPIEGFIKNTIDCAAITKLWINKMPCANCSYKLINFYKYNEDKPTLYIGEVYCNPTRDREGLKQLLQNGFKLKMWRRLNRLLQQEHEEDVVNSEVKIYLQNLKREIRNDKLDNKSCCLS